MWLLSQLMYIVFVLCVIFCVGWMSLAVLIVTFMIWKWIVAALIIAGIYIAVSSQ